MNQFECINFILKRGFNLHLTACSGDKYCMASACICKLESILLFSGNTKYLCGSKFLKDNKKII